MIAVAMDVTDRASVDAAVAKATEAFGPIDILINNAGLADPQPFLDMTEESWQKVIETNLTGVWRVGQAVARGMVARGRGSSSIFPRSWGSLLVGATPTTQFRKPVSPI